MTTAQKSQAMEALQELEALAPGVEWHVTYNWYTKLPEFMAMKDGSVSYSMYKQERRLIVKNEYNVTYTRYTGEKYAELKATYDSTTRESNGMLVSGAHNVFELPQAEVTLEMPRLNFRKYVQFVKDNLGMLERIGA